MFEKLSCVIIGRNEGQRLIRCIKSVLNALSQKYDLQIIYVDSGSSDNSIHEAAQLGCEVITLKTNFFTAGKARNVGWHQATAEWVLFLDGDTIFDGNFISHAEPFMKIPSNAVVFGYNEEMDPNGTIYNLVLSLEWIRGEGEVNSCAGNALIRKAVLETVNGYNDDLIAGEEPDLCRRIRGRGYKVILVPVRIAQHNFEMTRLSQYIKRAIRTGYAYAAVSSIYWNTDDPLWKKESIHNWIKGLLTIALFLGTFIFAIFTGNFLPFLIICILQGLLIAVKAFSWISKGRPWKTSIVYSVFAHLQHTVIVFGQASYWLNRLRNKQRGVMDYR